MRMARILSGAFRQERGETLRVVVVLRYYYPLHHHHLHQRESETRVNKACARVNPKKQLQKQVQVRRRTNAAHLVEVRQAGTEESSH